MSEIRFWVLLFKTTVSVAFAAFVNDTLSIGHTDFERMVVFLLLAIMVRLFLGTAGEPCK